MKLIVGLGNPGRKYVGTRHNIGYDVLAGLAKEYAAGANPKNRFQGELVEANIRGEKSLLLCPTTYMNKSGGSVQPARDFYKIDNSDLLVICDDFNLTLGKLRFRAKGSFGGQRGLEDIIKRLGTNEFSRLRIGIGPVPDNWSPPDFVLGKFTKEEQPEVERTTAKAVQAVAGWVQDGVDYCMNQYNG